LPTVFRCGQLNRPGGRPVESLDQFGSNPRSSRAAPNLAMFLAQAQQPADPAALGHRGVMGGQGQPRQAVAQQAGGSFVELGCSAHSGPNTMGEAESRVRFQPPPRRAWARWLGASLAPIPAPHTHGASARTDNRPTGEFRDPSNLRGLIGLRRVGCCSANFLPNQAGPSATGPLFRLLFIDQVNDGDVKAGLSITRTRSSLQSSAMHRREAPRCWRPTPIFDMDLPQRPGSRRALNSPPPPGRSGHHSSTTLAESWWVPAANLHPGAAVLRATQMGGGGAQGAFELSPKSKARVYVPDEESRVTFRRCGRCG